MVQLPGAHSHVIAIFGNQTYLTALAQSWHSGHAVHSFRGTFTITTGVNVAESTWDLRGRVGDHPLKLPQGRNICRLSGFFRRNRSFV